VKIWYIKKFRPRFIAPIVFSSALSDSSGATVGEIPLIVAIIRHIQIIQQPNTDCRESQLTSTDMLT